MIEHTYNVLEFNKLLDIVAGYASCPLGRSDCLALEPSRDLNIIDKEQRLVSEMKLLLKVKGFFPFSGLVDILPTLRICRAEGSCLESSSLLSILQTLQFGAEARSAISDKMDLCPGLNEIVKDMALCSELRSEISKSIDPNGTIKDSSSQRLKKIRRNKSALRRDLQRKLENIGHAVAMSTNGENHTVTLRNGRYVIPLRVDMRTRIDGIVHDYSRTHSTCFFEPVEVIKENNRLSELDHLEIEEELRILAGLTAMAREKVEDIIDTRRILGKLDGLYARALYSESVKGIRPVLDQEGGVFLKQAVNPILMNRLSDGDAPVPLDIILERDINVMIISGPNRGGKTVTLKTLGLLCLMAQSGLHIPVEEGSRLPVFKNIFAEIGDDQDIESGQSTFSAHVSHLKHISDHADRDTLIIIDEPGMGTDPDEGSALAMAVLDDFADRGSLVAVSTHYNRLKSYGLLDNRSKNVSMEFDDTTNRPTFSINYGAIGTSYAFEEARKQGINEELLSRALDYLDHDEIQLNELINKLNQHIHETEAEKKEAEKFRLKYHAARKKLIKTLKNIEDDSKVLLDSKREEAKLLVDEMREEFRRLINSMKNKDGYSQSFAQKQYNLFKEKLVYQLFDENEIVKPDMRLRPGQKVRHKGLNLEGKVVSIDSNNPKALIMTGKVKISVNKRDLTAIKDENEPESETASGKISYYFPGNPQKEVNIIGYRVEEALPLIDRIIDRSLVDGDQSFRIIHGHGTGKLKTAIRNHLKNISCVKKIKGEDPRYGGEAITLVELN